MLGAPRASRAETAPPAGGALLPGALLSAAMRAAVPALLAALVVLLVPTARAADRGAATLRITYASPDARYGQAHRARGTLARGGAPVAGAPIVLEGRPYPYRGAYVVLARTRTDARGAFTVSARLDRNHDLRVAAPAQAVRSDSWRAFLYPALSLSFRAEAPGVVRLLQRYRVPRGLPALTARTRFYLGPRGAARSAERVLAATRRTAPGRYEAHATVRLPRAWKGSFRYGSCLPPSAGVGLGDPARGCPVRLRF